MLLWWARQCGNFLLLLSSFGYHFVGFGFDMRMDYRASFVWKAIMNIGSLLYDGFKLHLGNREGSFWFSHWLPTKRLCDLVPFVHIPDTDFQICDV